MDINLINHHFCGYPNITKSLVLKEFSILLCRGHKQLLPATGS